MASSPPGIIITLVEKVDQESETWALVLTLSQVTFSLGLSVLSVQERD